MLAILSVFGFAFFVVQLSTCHINNKEAGEGSTGLEATDPRSILFLERCRVHHARGAAVTCQPGGSVAIVGCELFSCGGAGLRIRGRGRAVLNDSYVYWNGGPGVHVEPLGVMSLEHNDCSHNGGGPMLSEGIIRVRGYGFAQGEMGRRRRGALAAGTHVLGCLATHRYAKERVSWGGDVLRYGATVGFYRMWIEVKGYSSSLRGYLRLAF